MSTTEALVRALWAPSVPGEVFAILDAARDPQIQPSLGRCDLEYACLYDQPDEELASVAPYLVRLRPWSPYTNWLFEAGWGQAWGVLLTATAPLQQLRRHFRRFLLVRDEDGQQLYFRYYDPRVLRVYLPTCTAEEASLVFGDVTRFFAESDDGTRLVEFERAVDGARVRDVRVVRG